MNHRTRTSLATLIDTLNDSIESTGNMGSSEGLTRAELSAASGISYSHTCTLINQYEDYFIEDNFGRIKAVIDSTELPPVSLNRQGKGSNNNRRQQFELKLLEVLSDISHAISSQQRYDTLAGPANVVTGDSSPVDELFHMIKNIKQIQLPSDKLRLVNSKGETVKQDGLTEGEVALLAAISLMVNKPGIYIKLLIKLANNGK